MFNFKYYTVTQRLEVYLKSVPNTELSLKVENKNNA